MVAALFFVPAGLVVAELGAAFPNQGGPYVWARLAFGRRAGSLVALAYFLEPPVWVGGSLAITCVAVIDRLVLPLEGVWRVPVALAFVWTTVALAAAPLRAGKRVPLAGAATQVGLLVVFTATVAAYAAGHGVHAPAIGDLAPFWAVFALVAPVLVYNFLGFELPSAAGEELRDPARYVPASIVRAGVLTCALYAVPVPCAAPSPAGPAAPVPPRPPACPGGSRPSRCSAPATPSSPPTSGSRRPPPPAGSRPRSSPLPARHPRHRPRRADHHRPAGGPPGRGPRGQPHGRRLRPDPGDGPGRAVLRVRSGPGGQPPARPRTPPPRSSPPGRGGCGGGRGRSW